MLLSQCCFFSLYQTCVTVVHHLKESKEYWPTGLLDFDETRSILFGRLPHIAQMPVKGSFIHLTAPAKMHGAGRQASQGESTYKLWVKPALPSHFTETRCFVQRPIQCFGGNVAFYGAIARLFGLLSLANTIYIYLHWDYFSLLQSTQRENRKPVNMIPNTASRRLPNLVRHPFAYDGIFHSAIPDMLAFSRRLLI